MKYYSPEQLKKSKDSEVGEQLSRLSGKNVKYNLALNVFKNLANKHSFDKDIKILDLGTASGYFLKQLHQEGYHSLYAHDIDDYLPQEIKNITKEYKLSELSMEKLPWKDNFFDIVTAWCVLPHIENPFHTSREVARVLKPGGLFVFSAPNLISKPSIAFFKKYKYFGSYRKTNNHIALLPEEVVKKTTSDDFELIDKDYLIIPKIFKGLKGKFRKFVYDVASKKLKTKLKQRWSYNTVYILRKKDLKEENV